MATTTADVAKAKIALAQAEVNLDNATLVAPIAGTVATMPFTTGQQMTTSDKVTIIGSGSVRVTINVPETSIAQVAVGQAATVSVSAGGSSTGKVTTISILPASSSTSSTATYPVTVTVPQPKSGLAPGVTALASITVAQARQAVVLPVSAVTRLTDTTGTVTTLGVGNQTKTAPVGIGATGLTTVQIKSGLTAGQRVVVADNTQALPASNTASLRRAAGAGGGAGGGAGTGGFSGAAGVPAGAPPGGR